MMKQRLANLTCRLEAHEQLLAFIPRSWTAMGTAEGPRLFVMCFAEPPKEWNLRMHEEVKDLVVEMSFQLPRCVWKVGASLATSADDNARTLPARGGMLEEAKRVLEKNNDVLDKEIMKVDYSQNIAKQELVPRLRHQGQSKRFQKFDGRVLPSARHLGGQQSWDLNFRFEREKGMKGCSAMGRCAFAPVPEPYLRIMFIVRVQGTGLRGLES